MLFIDIRNLEDPNYSPVPPMTYIQMIRCFHNQSIPIYPLSEKYKLEKLCAEIGFALCEPIKLSFVKKNIPDVLKEKEYRVFAAQKDADGNWNRLYKEYSLKGTRLKENQKELRNNRNGLLTESDYIMMPDIFEQLTDEKKAAWLKYRKDLRDLPTKYDHPVWAIWPLPPQ
jgi:hypothetical protein